MKKLLSILLIAVMLFGICSLGGCWANFLSEEQHINNISKRIEKRYIETESEFTSFEIHPVYNNNDELKYFVVDFEPYGFIYVIIRNDIYSCFNIGHSMYQKSTENSKIESSWQRFTLLPDNGILNEQDRTRYETDENGEFIYYNQSPYKEANVENEKLFLLTIWQGSNEYCIPAIKRNDKYLNLISMTDMDISKEIKNLTYAYSNISFICKHPFDL